MFVNKPPGILVQRAYDPDEPVLFEILTSHLRARGEEAFMLQRLDRGTSGVLFFSKLSRVNRLLTRQFGAREIRKRYLALVDGHLAQPQLIDAPLARIGPISFGTRPHGRRALTGIMPLESGATASLLEVELHTGRTHQIRAHLSAIGHPLAGDWLYGRRDAPRPMLHAHSVSLIHPLSRERMMVEIAPPADFLKEMSDRGLSMRSFGSGTSRVEDRSSPKQVGR